MSTLSFTWEYTTPEGQSAGFVKRFDKDDGGKEVVSFFKPTPDGFFGAGGGEKPWPLFNLHNINNAKSIVIVEGEKCAQALIYLGIPATTSRGGWQSAKEADWTPCTKAEKIYLLPDADWQGENYIENVSKLITEINPNVRFFVCRVPFVSGGEDIVDWIQERCRGWDGYREFTTEEKETLKPLVKDFFKTSVELRTGKIEQTETPTSLVEHTAQLKKALTFPDVLSRYGKLERLQEKKTGWHLCSSPFTSDSNPSFNFNEKEKYWRCFSSGQSGDIFGLIAALEGISTKGDDWRKILEVSETITGLVRPKQEKKSNVTSILPKLPLDLNAVAHDIYSIPNENVSPVDAFNSCSALLQRIAGSDGTADEFVFSEIKKHFSLTSTTLKPFRKAVQGYRKDIKETGTIEDKKQEKPQTIEAPPELYLELLPKFLGKIYLDIFSGDAVVWDEQKKFYVPILNKMKGLKACFHRYGYDNHIRFWMQNVDYYLEDYCKNLIPCLPLEIPEWDGFDYIKKATDRVTLNEVITTENGISYQVTQDVFEETMKEWFSKLWEKFEDPTVQNPLIILQGPQNAGKDTWQANLLGGFAQYLVKIQKEDSIKDARAQLHTGVAVIVSEIDQLLRNKDDTALIKDMLTASRTNLRLPYDPRPCPRWVRCSFQGNCNPKEILKDPTGNRRFIIFEVAKIDWAEDGSKSLSPAEQLQVLAQAKHLASERYRMSDQSKKAIGSYIASKTPKSSMDAIIDEWDSSAQELFESLPIEQQELCTAAASGTGYFGFMPYSLMNLPATDQRAEIRFLSTLAEKDPYWSERGISTVLAKNGRRGFIWFGPIGSKDRCRGFFWQKEPQDTSFEPQDRYQNDEGIDFL